MRSEGLRWGGIGGAKALTCFCVLHRGKQVPWDHRVSQGCPGTLEIRYGADGEGCDGARAALWQGWGRRHPGSPAGACRHACGAMELQAVT